MSNGKRVKESFFLSYLWINTKQKPEVYYTDTHTQTHTQNIITMMFEIHSILYSSDIKAGAVKTDSATCVEKLWWTTVGELRRNR